MKNSLLEILDSARLLDEGETARILNIPVASLQRDRHIYSNKDISANAYRKRKDGD